MIREITIGQYYPAKSILHRLDPRVKLIGTFLFIVSLFVQNCFWGYLFASVFLMGVIFASKVPVRYILKGLKPVFMLLALTVVFNMFFLDEGNVILRIWKLTITDAGIRMACYMAIRLVYLILGSSIMTFTTTPNALTDAIERILYPLNRIRVPVHEIAMMMSIALRFIPILLEETDKIMKAQMARGADFENGSLFQRAKAMIPILVPLMISAFRRANDLALAMEARCYRGGEGRTKMKPLVYQPCDMVAYLVLVCYFLGCVAIGIVFS
jgi:energy-coupling factor transport system permease protein